MIPQRRNLLLLTDSYKASHWAQYPPKTTHVFSFFESRGGRYPWTVFFGLQYFIDTYLSQGVTHEDVEEAADIFRDHFGKDLFNPGDWHAMINRHGGKLPVVIKAVPEGTVVPTGNVLMTVENTDPQCPWLTNYLESLLVQVWYPTTVATQSRAMKKSILGFLARTGDPAGIDFKLHDFGFRGSTSPESAALGGAAHLVNFQGTDTVPALKLVRDVYDCPMAGFSVPAAEHSTITSWGRSQESELAAYRNMLEKFPSGIVAVVSDSYDIYRACGEMWGGYLRDAVQARDGCLVIRPDSGHPPTVLVRVLRILGDKFGRAKNEKGFNVLSSCVRVIQGDGIDHQMIVNILSAMVDDGWSADNLVFGSGGGLLQKVDRDTQKFAFKCSSVCVDGQDRDVIKQPITDVGKHSKAGRLILTLGDGVFKTERDHPNAENQLMLVFDRGQPVVRQRFDDIRHRAAVVAQECA